MKRIVYTLAIGEPRYAECALGLGRSLKLIGDQTRRIVVTNLTDYPWDQSFNEVLAPDGAILPANLSGLHRTDADQVLFLDADCLAFKRLDPIFEYCRDRGLSAQGCDEGMIYYERTSSCLESIKAYREGGGLHVLPDTADFICTADGLVGKLQLDVLRNRCSFVRRQSDLRLVKPFIFHASQHVESTNYLRELGRLRKLEEYAQSHEPGHVSPRQKLQRSIERRYLKFIRRKL